MCPDSRLTRRDFLGAGVGASTLVVAGCLEPDPSPPQESLRIHHLDVGQADATVLRTPENETMVVDTGDHQQDGQAVIDHLENLGVEHVDHLVATHAHADHIGGHAAVIEHFETEHDGIGLIYDSGVPHTTETYQEYIDAVDAYGHELLVVEEGESLPLGGVAVSVLNPPSGGSETDLDYNCVALQVEHDGVRYLTTGDAGGDAEQRMLSESSGQLPADIYQAGHHGSSTSSTEPFVDAVDPDTSVISSAYDSQFGHPDDEVLYRYDEFDIETYWTGVHAETRLTVEDGSVTAETDEPFSTDPLDILAEKPDSSAETRFPMTVAGSGTETAVVDRIARGTAVLLRESSGQGVGQSLVPANRLPAGAGEGTVLSVTVRQGTVRDISADTEATNQRSQEMTERLAQLSTPIGETR
jgi:competence protein ComEC